MLKLGNQRKDLRPIDLLLRQLEQQSIREKQSLVESQIDKQYEMLRQGRRDEMIQRTKLSEINNSKHDTKNDTDKIDTIVKFKKPIDKKPIVKKPIDNEDKILIQKRVDCFNGAMSACDYVNKHTKKKFDKNFDNTSIKYDTPDYVVDYTNGNPFIKQNPVVKDLYELKKVQDKKDESKFNDALKLGKQDRDRITKDYKPQQEIKIGYDIADVRGSTTI